MTAVGRIRATALAAGRSFLRRRTAVFFTFLFPTILILIFGVLVRTDAAGGGLFTRSPGYYVPGYLATVVLFTPLSRVGSEVARARAGNRFGKYATTPLTRFEWLAAQVLVNLVVVSLAAVLILALTIVLTGAVVSPSPALVAFVVVGVVLFCGIGAVLGSVADSQDGAVTASNTIGLPLLFLSDTFVPPDLLPAWFGPVQALSPLTYFARGTRAAIVTDAPYATDLGIALGLAVAGFLLGAVALPWRS
ncbi:ABC transporter permease [Halobacteriales archaeon SW_7_68_16]|nr:MAG: ABC transporter permease [Halobacteriales archaeon SW_7_68_16]